MNKRIKIGVLLPSSTILPISKDFETGLRSALKQHFVSANCELEITAEFIGQGGKSEVENAINKLFGYHEVDVITGVVSNQVGTEVCAKFLKLKKPFLINNIGEHIPNPKLLNPYVFINSTHTWQQIWSLGNWAVKQFGRKGMFVGSVYDAGYAFTTTLKLGMEAADPNCEMPFSIAPLTQQGATSDPKVVFEHIQQFKPDFVLSVFCGDEASAFQEEYIRLGYNKTIPLLALPYLLQPYTSTSTDLEAYTTMVARGGDTLDLLNIEQLNTDNPFHALGSEAGALLAQAFMRMEGDDITAALRKVNVTTARGILNINSPHLHSKDKVYLVKNTHQGDKSQIRREIIQELPTTSLYDAKIIEVLNQPSSGWGNPYLGV